MASSASAIFSRQVFAAAERGNPARSKPAQSFAGLFTSMLAREMRRTLTGGAGPLGAGGGASGDIYGMFFDQAMGGVLAKSSAMRPLVRSIARQIGSNELEKPPMGTGPSRANSVRLAQAYAALAPVGFSYSIENDPILSTARAALLNSAAQGAVGSSLALPSDNRGPVLMPPASAFQNPLPPPSPFNEI